MRQKTYHVQLSEQERLTLEQFVSTGTKNARQITRARILLLADAGKSDQAIMAVLGVSRPTVFAMRKKYAQRGTTPLLSLLAEASRRGRPIKVDSRVEAHATLIACSAPPEGKARWTLRLIADQMVKLEVIDTISHEKVRRLLKKTR